MIVLLLTLGASAGSAPVQLKSRVDILEKWTPDQHLYLKGNLGVSQNQLAALEK
ncbi:hypothetical protein N8513_00120 [bacterium]|nr:hypothetical protein [bacterium]MDB4319550.1 hypothetical protein [bacterium]MDB4740275.1 hypothetical protein [Akkermansiaceae bacterium]